jgi:hypothetical protein
VLVAAAAVLVASLMAVSVDMVSVSCVSAGVLDCMLRQAVSSVVSSAVGTAAQRTHPPPAGPASEYKGRRQTSVAEHIFPSRPSLPLSLGPGAFSAYRPLCSDRASKKEPRLGLFCAVA